MKYLLDTHVFLWTTGKSHLLSKNARKEIDDPANELVVSAVTFWEIAIKVQNGKLDIGKLRPEDLIPLAEKMGIRLIDLTPSDAATISGLTEASHFDPFDRILIWQAIRRKLILITKDSTFKKFADHGLELLWN